MRMVGCNAVCAQVTRIEDGLWLYASFSHLYLWGVSVPFSPSLLLSSLIPASYLSNVRAVAADPISDYRSSWDDIANN